MVTKYIDKTLYKEDKREMHYLNKEVTRIYKSNELVRGTYPDYSTMADKYFTIEALEDGTVGFATLSNGEIDTYTWDSTSNTWFFYSTDNGSSWQQEKCRSFQIPVTKGDKVLFKRNYYWVACSKEFSTTSPSVNAPWRNCVRVHCTCKYKVYGNIQSLWYGDNFYDESLGCVTAPKMLSGQTNQTLFGLCRYLFTEKYDASITITIDPSQIDVTAGDPLPIKPNSEYDNTLDMHFLVDASGLLLPFKMGEISSTNQAKATFEYMFWDCELLEHGPGMFYDNWNEPSFMRLGSAKVWTRDFQGMFANCYSLKDVPDYNFRCPIRYLSNTTNGCPMLEMFYCCFSLKGGIKRIIPVNTSSFNANGEFDMDNGMFFYCESLNSAPVLYPYVDPNNNTIHLGSQTDINGSSTWHSMFTGCYSLKNVALFNTRTSSGVTGPYYLDWNYVGTKEHVTAFGTDKMGEAHAPAQGCTYKTISDILK
jgi:hypothetical protein